MPRRNSGPKLRYLEDRKAFYITWTVNGRPQKRSTGTADSAKAQIIFAEWLALRGKPTGPRDPAQTLVCSVLQDYMVEAEPSKQTRIAYAVLPLLEFFGNNTVADITPAVCRNYCRKRGLSAGTHRRELGVLRAAVNHAYQNGQLTRPVPVAVPEDSPPRDRWLTRGEAARLLKAARAAPFARSYLPLFILIALYTGRRREAILSLRWPQIDLDAKLINFEIEGRARTDKRRGKVQIPARLYHHLIRARRHGTDLGFVINDYGKKIDRLDRSFQAAVKRAGLEKVTPHTFRHTAATWLMKAGIPIWEAGQYLSMSPATLTKVYAHHSPDFTRAAADAIGSRPGRGARYGS